MFVVMVAVSEVLRTVVLVGCIMVTLGAWLSCPTMKVVCVELTFPELSFA